MAHLEEALKLSPDLGIGRRKPPQTRAANISREGNIQAPILVFLLETKRLR